MGAAGRIDNATVQRILDAADIVEVVSDYVRLKRRGSGYIGLCPFHSDRNPSFSVNKAKGFCKCFSCGKGGTPVGFIMEIEQMTYPEALRTLAKKYNIEIEERELTQEEQDAENARQSLLAVNEFALQRFEHNLTDTQEGKNIGYSYFRERGIDDRMIKRFRLGYSLERRDALYSDAIEAGFKEKFLEESGLVIKSERGDWRDRFRARVIYPIFTISGKVVGFGGRTLRKDKDVAKYVNSPESVVYRKSYELYGLYQAKPAIVKQDKCILVEGYMDVISMHQAGVENVVASSGTALTEGQIRLIHRFTENVTVIYDSDAAGIKASLRGIDMLLAEGMKIKVLLLPDGDDPDSFAQSHSSSQVEEYIRDNETDFIAFKTKILLDGVENDPIRRSNVITDIVRTISVIPDQIMRTVYIAECSRTLGIDEKVLALQVTKFIAEKAEKDYNDGVRRKNYEDAHAGQAQPSVADNNRALETHQNTGTNYLTPYEKELLRYVVRYGMLYLGDMTNEAGDEEIQFNVLDFVRNSMADDGIEFTTPDIKRTYEIAQEYVSLHWIHDKTHFEEKLKAEEQEKMNAGIAKIKAEAIDLSDIHRLELELKQRVEKELKDMRNNFESMYMVKALASSPDDTVRRIASDLADEKHRLSKIHTKFSSVETERDRLKDLVPMAYYNLQEAIIELRIRELRRQIQTECAVTPRNDAKVLELMAKQAKYNEMKKELARYLGERIIAPKKR
ncbi:DNA primase [Muribaculaceae bacterium Isolate-104 (HZI)]|nr:DNA primase [Muribaculaceae bacterium Isolate-104 (HZI)]